MRIECGEQAERQTKLADMCISVDPLRPRRRRLSDVIVYRFAYVYMYIMATAGPDSRRQL